MTNSIDNTQDLIDVRDIIERYEELEAEREALSDHVEECEAANEYHNSEGDMDAPEERDLVTANDDLKAWDEENSEELENLKSILDDLKGNGGDEQWRGDWYPVTLIRESYFEEYMDEMVADCYELPELPSFMTVTLDYVALQMDYTSTEIDGVTYLYR